LESGRFRLLRGHLNRTGVVACAPKGEFVVSGGEDRAVHVWDLNASPDPNLLQGHTSAVNSVALSPDDQTLASAEFHQGITKVWNLSLRQAIASLPFHTDDDTVGSVTFSPDGRYIASFTHQARVTLWDAANYERVADWTNEFGGASVAFSPDGKILALSNGFLTPPARTGKSLAFWDVAQRRRIDKLSDAEDGATAVQFSPDGLVVAVSYENGFVRLWNWETSRKVGEFQKHTGPSPSLAFSSDGKLLASGGAGKVVIYALATKNVAAILDGNVRRIRSVDFAPDGKTLAAAGDDGTVSLWNPETTQHVLTLQAHRLGTTDLAFSRDGRLLVSSGADGAVRLWPAAPFEAAQ
jgi:WD40 repeat protein